MFLKSNSLLTPNSLILLLNVTDSLRINIRRDPTSRRSWKICHCHHHHHLQLFLAPSVCAQQYWSLGCHSLTSVFDLTGLQCTCCQREMYAQRRNKIKSNKVYRKVCCCTLKLMIVFRPEILKHLNIYCRHERHPVIRIELQSKREDKVAERGGKGLEGRTLAE